MDKPAEAPRKESCTLCRWMELKALPYGAVEYVCASRQRTIPSDVVSTRRCPRFQA